MEVTPDILRGATRGWIVGPKYDLCNKEFRYIYEAVVQGLGYRPKHELNVRFTSPGSQRLIFPWGAIVETRSEEAPDTLLGEEIDWLILSEGSRLKEQTFDQYLRARLGSRLGRCIVPTTPHGYNWIYKRFYIPATEGNPNYFAKIVPVTENALFSKEEFERAKEELPEEIFREQYCGEFVSYTGLIFKRFSRQLNVIPPIPIKPDWTRYCAIDPHPQTPCAVLWAAIDEHDTMYLYDEMFVPNLTIEEIAERMKKREGVNEPYKRLIDPRAKYVDKLRGQTASVQQQFRSAGISCLEADSKFESGYYRIEQLLTPKPVYGHPDVKKPSLFVFSTLKETINEFETLTFEDEKAGKGGHCLDGLKYIVNDNPVRSWRDEERREAEREEREYTAAMNPVTGY
jgi:hypothetical protein